MFQALRFPVFLLSCFFLFGCSNSKETAKKNADGMVAEYNALVASLNQSKPAVTWSEDQLRDYEKKLDRLETLEKALEVVDGKNGITVIGGNNQVFVATLRNQIHAIRQTKKIYSNKAPQEIKKENPLDKLAQLRKELNDVAFEMKRLGVPNSSWSVSRLEEYLALVDEALEINQNISETLALLQDKSYAELAPIEENMEHAQETLTDRKTSLMSLIQEKTKTSY